MYAYVGIVRPVGRAQQAGEPAERIVGRVVLPNLDLAETLAKLQQHV